jgi:hypothetical protein
VQPFVTAPSLDTTATISVVAFSPSLPIMTHMLMVNRRDLCTASIRKRGTSASGRFGNPPLRRSGAAQRRFDALGRPEDTS